MYPARSDFFSAALQSAWWGELNPDGTWSLCAGEAVPVLAGIQSGLVTTRGVIARGGAGVIDSGGSVALPPVRMSGRWDQQTGAAVVAFARALGADAGYVEKAALELARRYCGRTSLELALWLANIPPQGVGFAGYKDLASYRVPDNALPPLFGRTPPPPHYGLTRPWSGFGVVCRRLDAMPG